jgi:hypothetical protein
MNNATHGSGVADGLTRPGPTSAYVNGPSPEVCRVFPRLGLIRPVAFTNPFTDSGADLRLLKRSVILVPGVCARPLRHP